jgi:hypothetical protein
MNMLLLMWSVLVGSSDVYEMPTRYFALPIGISDHTDISHFEIHVSVDHGKTWIFVSETETDRFTFLAPKDGLYWFSKKAIKEDGTKFDIGIVKVLVKSGDLPFESEDRKKLREYIERLEDKVDKLEELLERIELRRLLEKRLKKK